MADPSVNPSPRQLQPEDSSAGLAAYTDSVLRKVSVKGSGGATATVVIIAQQGQVWVSIMPPFTWEAIMDPGKVDEVIRALGLARDDAKKMAMVRGRRASREDKAGVRTFRSDTATQRAKEI